MPTDLNQIALSNRRKVLDALRISGRMARVELAETTGLSPATVTAVTAELLNEGFVEACAGEGDGAARRGRPKVDLRLRPDAARVAGVKISLHRISVTITNFAGELLGASEISVRANHQPPERIAQMVDEALETALRAQEMSRNALHGVGIGLPGFVDGETGVSHWSPVFGEGAYDVAALFSKQLQLPCFVDNDANLATVAEHWFGRGKGRGDMLAVTIEHGVGMGMVIGGRLYRGAHGIGAEFGHTKIRPGGALCRCGQRGCIEAYLADYAILREVSTFRRTADPFDPLAVHAALAEIQAEGMAGDPRIRAIYARAGEILGIGLANLINIFGPELLVVSGAGSSAAPLFEPAMREALAANTLSAAVDRTPVEITQSSDALWAHGAAALVLTRSAFGSA
ncbi:MAG: ROK family transcriptional regulator [Neomegalonema sp.]|nr:ROK family transcriptional regulator [Neomegalonema sp.]